MNRPTLTIAFIALLATGCGPMTTEPMPDIPETVEYETVRLEYGDDDLLEQTESGLRRQPLVGDPSFVAALSRTTVQLTNRLIYDQLRLIEGIKRFDPTDYAAGVWTWENHESKAEDERFLTFQIIEVSETTFRYRLYSGNEVDDMPRVFSGEFTTFGPRDGRQRGFGTIRFDLDAMRQIDPEADVPEGEAIIAFRARGGVRQVVVGLDDFRDDPSKERTDAIYRYTQLPRGQGRFRFSSRADFLEDGAPLERFGIDAVWNTEQIGRARARVDGGSLRINELLLEECWDAPGDIVFADLTPDIESVSYEDGERESCDAGLLDIALEPPQAVEQITTIEVPQPHPDEREE